MLTHEQLLELVHYDPATGIFTWKARPGVRAGKQVGTVNRHGYVAGAILRKKYDLHRVAWFYMTGSWPSEVDHRNRKKADNRWRNLREATRPQNSMNCDVVRSKTGFKGVTMLAPTRDGRIRFKAQLSRKGTTNGYLGTFDTPEEAHATYVRAAKAAYGEFAEHL